MSKVDAQRAMKAARNSRTATPAPGPAVRPTTPRAAAAAGAAAAPTTAGESGAALPAAGDALCGHRNMAGKECRRPAGHAEKSHRYS